MDSGQLFRFAADDYQYHYHGNHRSYLPPPRPVDLEVTIVSAKHLKNVNWRNGEINPYVILWLHPDHRLATKSDDSNSTKPVWNEFFTIPLPSSPSAAVLTLEIFHSKPYDTPKPLVGALRLPINDLSDLENPTVIRTFDLRRPSCRLHGKIRLKLALRERLLPDYQNAPQPAYYYATAHHSFYGGYPPSPYHTSPPLPPPPAVPSPPHLRIWLLPGRILFPAGASTDSTAELWRWWQRLFSTRAEAENRKRSICSRIGVRVSRAIN
ncbi:hypothetical protein R6Q57_027329 [Mikania cordata]